MECYHCQQATGLLGKLFKLGPPEALRPTSVLNLSCRILTAAEVKVLSLGQKFIPQPPKIDKTNILKGHQHFDRRIKLTYFFRNKKQKQKLPFLDKSVWIPPLGTIPEEILEPLDHLKTHIEQHQPPDQKTRLGSQQIKTLRQLKSYQDIIIKPADKGSSIVILDTKDYIQEATQQLNNPKHYSKIPAPVYPTVTQQIKDILDSLKRNRILEERQIQHLKPPEEPRNRMFYLLPKIHKSRDKWLHGKIPPGRPIVSDCSSDTYNISEFIDHYLKPVSNLHPSYVKDTPDFITKIRSVKVPPKALLITLDVDALYTNIDNTNGLKAVQDTFNQYPDPSRPQQQILDLLKISLENNDFTFNNEWFLQIWGTAMGKKFAPEYADIFMANWEKGALSKCPLKPLIYLRFLDDIFIIWTHSRTDFEDFFNILNTHMDTVKLKSTVDEHSIDFLDVTVYKGQNFLLSNHLDTKVFFKPTDTHELLHKASFHPKHTFSGIIKSQILRFHRICNNQEDFRKATSTLFSALIPRGYSMDFLRKVSIDTLKTLHPSTNAAIRPPCSNKCTLCGTYFNPHYDLIRPGEPPIPAPKDLNCNSNNVVYAISCNFCQKLYIGQTSRSLRHRIIEHKSNILTNQNKPLANHINNCPLRPTTTNQTLFRLTPLEFVPINECALTNRTNLINREVSWIKKLNTTEPKGINSIKDLPPPIPFVSRYSKSSRHISNLVKQCYQKIQNEFPSTFRGPLVMAHSRNKNTKDYTVATKDP